MLSTRPTKLLALIGVLALGSESIHAQGVALERDAIVLAGSAANCARPATISYSDVSDATPEWQEIESEGVRKGSARYAVLAARMGQRITAAAKTVARVLGHDLIVVEGDISDPRGLEVQDITELIIDELHGLATTPSQ